jgi:hypothetical protein
MINRSKKKVGKEIKCFCTKYGGNEIEEGHELNFNFLKSPQIN